jgi:hypothetical protein
MEAAGKRLVTRQLDRRQGKTVAPEFKNVHETTFPILIAFYHVPCVPEACSERSRKVVKV